MYLFWSWAAGPQRGKIKSNCRHDLKCPPQASTLNVWSSANGAMWGSWEPSGCGAGLVKESAWVDLGDCTHCLSCLLPFSLVCNDMRDSPCSGSVSPPPYSPYIDELTPSETVSQTNLSFLMSVRWCGHRDTK